MYYKRLPPTRSATLAHIAPFAAYVALMAVERTFALPQSMFYPIRVAIVVLLLVALSRRYIALRPSAPLLSIVLGAVVFLVWIAPDVLFGFGYRQFWLFHNPVLGSRDLLGPPSRNAAFLMLHASGSALLVPVFEELFWRAWLMRWMISPEFLKVPFGTYQRAAFWTVAVLFAAEHGVYWDVGLAAGILYTWWAVRSRNLADCILAHAVTNGLLAAYVVAGSHWEYWP